MDERAQLARSRRGDRNAFADLYDEHAPAAWRVAVVAGRDLAVAASAVLDASVRVLGPGDQDPGQGVSLPVQLVAAARSAAVDTVHLPSVALHLVQAMPELSALDTRAERSEGVLAFDGLPERWRTALWLRHVERLAPREAGAVLGLEDAEVIQLCGRAEQGLHEQLAQAHASAVDAPGCQRATTRLAAYAEGSLEGRDASRVRRHLDRCEACRQRLDALDDLTPHLHRIVPSLPLTLRDLAEQRWRTAVRDAGGPFGVLLPSGALAPAWVERTLAGVTAGFVGLGITAILSLGARRSDDPVTRDTAAAQPVGAPDGESALRGELPGDDLTDGSSTVISIEPGPSVGGDDPSGPAPAGAPEGDSARPRGDAPGDLSEPPPPTTPTTAPSTTPPSSDDSSDPITEAVDDALDPLPTELCTAALDDLTCSTSSVGLGLPKL